MKKQLIVLLLSLLPAVSFAMTGKACGTIECNPIATDMSDKASLQNGAKLFVNYCMGCHSMKYMRYERMATDLGIPPELMLGNLVLDGNAKIGDLMANGMQVPYAKKTFGVAPLDLSLVARSRSPEWIYTYLRNFYADPARPYGVNNRVFKDVAMPFVLMELQGLAECAPGPKATDPTLKAEQLHDVHGIAIDPLSGELIGESPCGSLKVRKPGSMTAEQYDQAVYDLVNFLTYAAEPMAQDRERIGYYVLAFLAFFFIFAYLLNREYWKDVH